MEALAAPDLRLYLILCPLVGDGHLFVVNNARHRIAFVDVVLVDADEFNGVGRSFLCHACAECHHDISAVARTVECRCVEKTGVFVVGAFIYDADICASAGLKLAVSAPARSVCQARWRYIRLLRQPRRWRREWLHFRR